MGIAAYLQVYMDRLPQQMVRSETTYRWKGNNSFKVFIWTNMQVQLVLYLDK